MRRMFKRKKLENYSHLEVVERPNSFVSEAIQKLIINLEHANVDGKFKAIQVTSTLASEGKTTLAGNMAILLAQRNYKVIVIDLDLRKPKMHRLFQFSNDVGIVNCLHGSATIGQAVKKTTHGIDVLVAGERTSAVSNLLQSTKLVEIINKFKEEYDYVLIDTPPIQVNSDAVMISKLIDGVIYVVAYDAVKKNLIRDGVNELKRHDIPIIGTVFTQYKMPKRAFHYNYYYYDDEY